MQDEESRMTTKTRTQLRAKVSHHVAQFVVVSNPGTLFERIEDYCSTLKGALECKSCYDEPCDVMRVLPSGELTTEF
jgi:hypothetical protein